MSSSVTHKRLFQNTGTLERSKIGKPCLVSCECVEETRARQIRRYARALEVCSALLGRRMVRKENEKDPNGRDERVGRSSWCCCGCGSRGQPSAITAVITPISTPAFLRSSSYFLSSLKILVSSQPLPVVKFFPCSPPSPSPQLPTPKTQRRGVLRKSIDH